MFFLCQELKVELEFMRFLYYESNFRFFFLEYYFTKNFLSVINICKFVGRESAVGKETGKGAI